MDYKQSQGMRYTTAFRIKERSEWSAGMVLRILKNPVYTGVLEQGRVTTPSYRVKRLVYKPRDQWAVVEDCRASIIDKFDFETAQRVLATPESGYIIFFDWPDEYGVQDVSSDHVGIVEKVEGGRVYTIEGNSGDACERNSYPIGNYQILGYGTPML